MTSVTLTRVFILAVSTLHAFFYKQHFYKQRQAEIDQKSSNAKQLPEAELFLFKNFTHFSFTLSSRNNGTYSKKKQKDNYICIHEITRLIIMKIKMKMKKNHIDKTKIDLDQDKDTNVVVNIRSVSV